MLRAKTSYSVWLKTGECFPNLLEIPSYREKNKYLRRIKKNQAFISHNSS